MRTGRPKATRLIPLYAEKEDLLPVLEALESDGSVKYVRTGGQLPEPSLIAFDHAKDIPNLGKATSETGNFCDTFLVCKSELQIVVRSARVLGQERFFVDQLHNPNTVTFTPAGMWNQDILLAGRVMTVGDTSHKASAVPSTQHLFATTADQHDLALYHPNKLIFSSVPSDAGSSIAQAECA
jgi:hypothetical protein